MKATKIYYKELRTCGNYNNKEVGIELEIQDGEKAADVFNKAKIFVQSCLASNSLSPEFVESLVRSVKAAESTIRDFATKAQASLDLDDEIPF